MPLQLALSLQAHFAYGALIRAGGRVAGDILEVIAQSAGDHRKWCLARSRFTLNDIKNRLGRWTVRELHTGANVLRFPP